jgi:GntR family transcriptional regulator
MGAPLLLLDPASPIPPSEQMRMQIRLLIATGRLVAGDVLPSVRQLARDLGVAPNTVVRAYSELQRDGWVVTSARRGVLVAPRPPERSLEERARELERAVAHLLVTAHQLGVGQHELRAEIGRQLGGERHG